MSGFQMVCMPTYDKNVFCWGSSRSRITTPFLTNQENQSIFAVLETANLNGTKRKNPMFFLSVGTNGFSIAV